MKISMIDYFSISGGPSWKSGLCSSVFWRVRKNKKVAFEGRGAVLRTGVNKNDVKFFILRREVCIVVDVDDC